TLCAPATVTSTRLEVAVTTTVDDRHGPDGRQTGSATYHSPPLDPHSDPDQDGAALSVSVKEFTTIADAARWAPSLHNDQPWRLAAMITRRRSYQRIYRSHLVAENDLQALQRAAAQQGGRLVVLSPAARDELATLTEQLGGPGSGDTLGRSTVLALCTDADARA